MERRLTAQRRNSHGRDANRVLRWGANVFAEKISYEAWQKSRYGKSLRFRAPALFVEILRGKAAAFADVPTQTTYLSQRCVCGARRKKDLSERKHTCSCEHVGAGRYAQRDEMSAFLALFIENDKLNEKAALAAWKKWGAKCLLRSGSSKSGTINDGDARRNTRGLPQSCSAENGREPKGEAQQRRSAVCGESLAASPEPRLVEATGGCLIPPALAVGNS